MQRFEIGPANDCSKSAQISKIDPKIMRYRDAYIHVECLLTLNV